MDLKQRKLNKSEWNSIEVPVSEGEINILKMIISGYRDVNIKVNNNHSIFTFLKIEYTPKMEDQIYNKYFSSRVDAIEEKLKRIDSSYKKMKIDGEAKINSADKIRLDRFDESSIKKNDIYEFTLLFHIEEILSNREKNIRKSFHQHYYTLYKLIKNSINKLNRHIVAITNIILAKFQDEIDMAIIIEHSVDFIEKNSSLLKYADLTLYEHQKTIFTAVKNMRPKLILYMAPTGTGKTLTPIALSEEKRVIFVCAARHVGLALAKAAISVNRKIAFAFGCESADDIRLHYFAAKEYTKNKRSGGIGKVDNSVGNDVELIICDIKSYLPAMYYMLAFNRAENIVFYWDEPTITLDYNEHEFHSTIRKNWKKNIIPNIVLSSATLPKMNELSETIPDFMNKFPGGEICNIISNDCKKSIPIINKDGYVVLPHYLYEDYEKIKTVSKHCEGYMTLLRYFDLKEVSEFIHYVVIKNNYASAKMTFSRHFESLDDITMTSIKVYYVKLLQNILGGTWGAIHCYFTQIRKPRIVENNTVNIKGAKIAKVKSVGPGTHIPSIPSPSPLSQHNGQPIVRLTSDIHPVAVPSINITPTIGTSGIYVTTKDSYTLTDGPTIFISNEVEKIAKFCIQQANIPVAVMDDIMKKIEYNNIITEKINTLENLLEFLKNKTENSIKNNVSGGRKKSSKDIKMFNRDVPDDVVSNTGEITRITNELTSLRSMIKTAVLNDTFVPNKKLHLDKWAEGIDTFGAFTSHIDEHIVSEIMSLHGVDNSWKILLLMGIGVFINHENITYTEIMKKLADEQKLYMIIASSDYIYGTNYQFCHGFLSKDLNLTQEKIIQAMGRIGRNNIQQTYTVRFRDDEQILKLFTSETDKPEIINMNKLFNSKKVVFENNVYREVEESDDIDDNNSEGFEDVEVEYGEV